MARSWYHLHGVSRLVELLVKISLWVCSIWKIEVCKIHTTLCYGNLFFLRDIFVVFLNAVDEC